MNTVSSPIQYLDKAMNSLHDLGLLPQQAGEEAPVVALLNQISDLDEALVAAASIGDDRMQKQARGFAIPHTFTHGSSKQRVEWFAGGVKNGRLSDCETFAEQ